MRREMRARHMSIRRPSLLSKHPNPANFVGCHLFPHPCTLLVPRLRPGNARHPRLRLGFQAEPVNHGGSQAGAWEPDTFCWLSPFSPPVHPSRSQAPAWERTAPEAPPRFSGGACKSRRFPGGSLGTRQQSRGTRKYLPHQPATIAARQDPATAQPPSPPERVGSVCDFGDIGESC